MAEACILNNTWALFDLSKKINTMNPAYAKTRASY